MKFDFNGWRSGGPPTCAADWAVPATSDCLVTAAPSALVRSLKDRYAFECELGSGGMATVYLARDLQTGSPVAVKVLRADLIPILGAERFGREIRITSRLKHPNILPVLDSGQAEDGVPFYITPYVEGESLATRLLREGQLPIPDAIDIACQVADALEAAHSQGFIHRDIKPSNILLANGRAILADFGIARAVDVVTAEKLTESGIALGTPAYMSPEQSACGSLDGRSDIYSLGCVLFEMLAGSPPFVGPSAQSVRARHALDPPPSLRTVRNTVTPALERAIDKAMAKVPADRFPSAAAFAASLNAEPLPEQSGILRSWRPSTRLAIGLGSVAAIAGAAVLWPGPGPPPSTGVGVVIAPFDRVGDSLPNAGSSAHLLFAEAVEWVPRLHALDGSRLLGTVFPRHANPGPDSAKGRGPEVEPL